jgi:transposase InsO family protein
MMIDQDVVYVSPATTYRVLKEAGVLSPRKGKPSKKGTGFKHALRPHEQWHTDITYIKIKGVFFYLILVLDGFSRYIVAWDLRKEMTERDVEVVIQKGREAFPGTNPRMISDCGSQFVSKDFRDFIRLVGLTHTTTSPYYPQSNGKLERCNRTIKDFLRTKYLEDFEHGLRLINAFVDYYCEERLHSAIGYVTPSDMLKGKAKCVQEARETKLASARARRRFNWQAESLGSLSDSA